MATQVIMPKLSPTMEEGQIARWLKQEGDKVSTGEGLVEVDTDKATMEAQALTNGVLRKILVREGETAKLGDLIAVIGEADEDISEFVTSTPPADAKPVSSNGKATQKASAAPDDKASAAPTSASPKPAPDDSSKRDSSTVTATATPATGNGDARTDKRLIVSPLAARMAAEAGVNLNGVAGSGPGGRIIKRDIEQAMNAGASSTPVDAPTHAAPHTATTTAAASETPSQTPTATAAYRDDKNSEMRRTIARRLLQSTTTVPQFYLTTDIEMDKAINLRAQLNEMADDDNLKISINDMLIKVAAVALMRHPQVNASYQDQTTRYYQQADIGVAVALEDGLITPIVRAANTKSVGHISREVKELAARARDKKLKPEEYTGATFSISNLGMLGIDEFTAIINPPEAAILAVGQSLARPVVRNGQIEVANLMRVTMTCDHRIIDGATGAKFLQTFKQILENPMRLLL